MGATVSYNCTLLSQGSSVEEEYDTDGGDPVEDVEGADEDEGNEDSESEKDFEDEEYPSESETTVEAEEDTQATKSVAKRAKTGA